MALCPAGGCVFMVPKVAEKGVKELSIVSRGSTNTFIGQTIRPSSFVFGEVVKL